MSRLIDRDALRQSIDADCATSNMPKMWYAGIAFAINHIIHAPKIDAVEVVHGEWIEDEYGFIHCSICGMEYDEPEHYKTNYCPNCGAKMDGEVNDDGN